MFTGMHTSIRADNCSNVREKLWTGAVSYNDALSPSTFPVFRIATGERGICP